MEEYDNIDVACSICGEGGCDGCPVCNPPCPYCDRLDCVDAQACFRRYDEARRLSVATFADMEKGWAKRRESHPDEPPF